MGDVLDFPGTTATYSGQKIVDPVLFYDKRAKQMSER